jgi:hypothetical protein
LGFLTGINQKTEGRRELVVLLTPHIWSVEEAMAHAPAPHPNGAFSATGPVANASTTFDLETGGAGAGTGAPGPMATAPTDPAGGAAAVAAPGATPNAPMPGSPANLPADQRTMNASSGGPAQGRVGAAAAGQKTDPRNAPESQRRRWPSLRDWMSRRSRDRQGDPAPGVGAASQPLAQGPNALATPPSGDPASAMPRGVSPFPAGPSVQPLPSPQQPAEPEGGRPNLDLGPESAQPIGAASNERIPRRDQMLARAVWQPDRVDEARKPAEPDERRETRPAAAAETQGAPSGRVVAGPRRHTIVRGETLESITRQYYGSDRYAESLRQFNQGRIARGGLRPGDLLVIPPRDELSASGGWVIPTRPRFGLEPAGGGDTGDVARSRRRREAQPDESAGSRNDPTSFEPRGTRYERTPEPGRRRPTAVVHVVGPNETPRSIARDRLGDSRRAREIIELNQDRLAAEGRWRPGLRIVLPSDAQPSREAE